MKLSTIVLGLSALASAQESAGPIRDLGKKRRGFANYGVAQKAPIVQMPTKKGHMVPQQVIDIPTIKGHTHVVQPSKKAAPAPIQVVAAPSKATYVPPVRQVHVAHSKKAATPVVHSKQAAVPVVHSKQAAVPVVHQKGKGGLRHLGRKRGGWGWGRRGGKKGGYAAPMKAQPIVSKKAQQPVYVVQQQVSKQIPVIPQIATHGKKGAAGVHHGYY
ncbi:hypothetical protein GNI_101380 [Gregarina niphandrodes]|uniref:Transmembrane protein n=1 Tax=Gregarina niphandrodes TaxID=110365 RepID=A0A023B4G5_GRENI|nr:hypothetical protein GNI_101380 [Gregarina niphandrodes]EZG56756.1 hypothetical protein GNI_101380 [Gregarina niphandrodes]|eukprot:XP_011131165.1 hypothetical protein GNI_101380 [Gregarina niphandrodes]